MFARLIVVMLALSIAGAAGVLLSAPARGESDRPAPDFSINVMLRQVDDRPFELGTHDEVWGRTVVPGGLSAASVLFPGSDDPTALTLDTLDLDPDPDRTLRVVRSSGDDGFELLVIDACDTDGGRFAVTNSTPIGPIAVTLFRGAGDPGQAFEVNGDDSSIVELDCPTPTAGESVKPVKGVGAWTGAKGAESYGAPVTMKPRRAGRGRGSMSIRGNRQIARRLGSRRSAYRYNGRGVKEVTIPVKSRKVKKDLVIDSVVVAAPTDSAPTDRQLVEALDAFTDTEVLRLYKTVAGNRRPNGPEALGFRKNADWWTMQFTTRDDPGSQALVDDLFPQTVPEVPAADPAGSLFELDLEILGDPGQAFALPLVSTIALGESPIANSDGVVCGLAADLCGSWLSLFRSAESGSDINVVVIADAARADVSKARAALEDAEANLQGQQFSEAGAQQELRDAQDALDELRNPRSVEIDGRLPEGPTEEELGSAREQIDDARIRLAEAEQSFWEANVRASEARQDLSDVFGTWDIDSAEPRMRLFRGATEIAPVALDGVGVAGSADLRTSPIEFPSGSDEPGTYFLLID